MGLSKIMYLGCLVLLVAAMVMVEGASTPPGIAKNPARASCNKREYKMCYNLEHVCPKFCPDSCTVECASCKPICSGGSSPPPPTEDGDEDGKGGNNKKEGDGDKDKEEDGEGDKGGKKEADDDKDKEAEDGEGDKGGKKEGDGDNDKEKDGEGDKGGKKEGEGEGDKDKKDDDEGDKKDKDEKNDDEGDKKEGDDDEGGKKEGDNKDKKDDDEGGKKDKDEKDDDDEDDKDKDEGDKGGKKEGNDGKNKDKEDDGKKGGDDKDSGSPPPYSPPSPTPPSPSPPTTPTPSPKSPTPSPSPPTPTPPTTPTPSPKSPTPSSPPPKSSGVSPRKRVQCKNKSYGQCYNQQHVCPASCPTSCQVDCVTCKPVCSCDYPGAVCQDPRFVGGDGTTFYFHGKKNQDFCLVTDRNLHINAHFIGKRNENMGRDFTWVESIGILFNNHRLFVGAKKTSTWNDANDRLSLAFDGVPVDLEESLGYEWRSTSTPQVTITRSNTEKTNNIVIEVQGKLKITAQVVPITEQESRVHNYGITKEDCLAHLDLGFKFMSLTRKVEGVLGKTYREDYVNKVNARATMSVVGGEKEYASSNIFATDCLASTFNGDDGDPHYDDEKLNNSLELASMKGEVGVVCKR